MTINVRPLGAALFLTLGACASRPATAPTPSTSPTVMSPVEISEAPRNWMLLDPTADRVYGISLLRAERELLASKQPQRTVVRMTFDLTIKLSRFESVA